MVNHKHDILVHLWFILNPRFKLALVLSRLCVHAQFIGLPFPLGGSTDYGLFLELFTGKPKYLSKAGRLCGELQTLHSPSLTIYFKTQIQAAY